MLASTVRDLATVTAAGVALTTGLAGSYRLPRGRLCSVWVHVLQLPVGVFPGVVAILHRRCTQLMLAAIAVVSAVGLGVSGIFQVRIQAVERS